MSDWRSASRRSAVRLLALALVVLAGALVLWLAVDLFPYHSANDDEGVYLLQAAMLLDGNLVLRPDLPADAVRPWFFVLDQTPAGPRLYAKYTPVAAAVFAAGKLLGAPRVVLGVVAAANAALVYRLTAMAFDRRTGVLALVALVGSPLFLVSSAVFLSYAPTTTFNLLFAYGYVKAARTGRLGYAALAGTAIGIAFFSRAYTAVLFASPFVVHALLVLYRARRTGGIRDAFRRYLAIALPGLGGVATTLAYNAAVTGDPLLFPYEAFGPRDGLGFGTRELLGYELQYTPALAAETTVRVLVEYVTDWMVAGVVGGALFVAGLALVLPRDAADASRPFRASTRGLTGRELRALLATLVPAIVLGNAYFWGTHNGLENGLVDLLGPFYHFDLLLPASAFTAASVVELATRARRRLRARFPPSQVRGLLLVALLVAAPTVGVVEAGVVGDAVRANQERTEVFAETYAPVENADFERAVVFTPDPYGDWQAHPFQYLRNDPGFDGSAVYATQDGPARTFRVLAATENRTPYRFTYRGTWRSAAVPVTPELQELRVVSGERVSASTTLGVPEGTTHARVRLETSSGYARYAVDDVTGPVTVNWTLAPDAVRVTNHPASTDASAVGVSGGASEVVLRATFVDASGSTVTYRQSVDVHATGDEIRVVWPPETRVCRLQTSCGREGTYVGPEGEYLPGVSVTTSAETEPRETAG